MQRDVLEAAMSWRQLGRMSTHAYRTTLAAALTALLLATWAWAGDNDPSADAGSGDAETDWEADWDLEERIAAVSDGDLRFLPVGSVADAHIHHNEIRIGAASLRHGWIRLVQCHDQLDAVPAAQVTFRPGRIRNLRVERAESIGRAWVEGHTVQLTDVGHGAKLCVSGESRALSYLGEGRYRLQNGPYMRRFLDGYYPMRVVLDVRYPDAALRLISHQPDTAPGFDLQREPGRVLVDAAFEGRLYTCLDFLSPGAISEAAPLPCPADQGPATIE
jgi:hypothetical protein